jgi:hypothetical protein
MGRPRLTEAEKLARRRERNAYTFSDAAYDHYDVDKLGFGDPWDWERIAEILFGQAKRVGPFQGEGPFRRFLGILGLHEMPENVAALTKAFKAAMFKAHPDHGGTNQAAREVLEAYAILKKEF